MLATENPGTSAAVIRMTIPFKIKVNKPRVRIVNGRVRINNIGLMIVLIKLKIIATTIAVKKLSTFTPGRTYAVIQTARPRIRMFIKNFIDIFSRNREQVDLPVP